MNAPRYLLRLKIIKEALKKMRVTRFLELGYGQGELLLEMARQGYKGDAYDPSQPARQSAMGLLTKHNAQGIRLLEAMPMAPFVEHRYSVILFFEMVGYVENPEKWLNGLSDLLEDEGCLLFSFTNSKHCGPAERANGDMRCFSRSEMRLILDRAGYSGEIINYGFPLTNMLRPFLHIGGFMKLRRQVRSHQDAVYSSGQAASGLITKALYGWFSPVLVRPFIALQSYFKNTDAGTGYLVVAQKR